MPPGMLKSAHSQPQAKLCRNFLVGRCPNGTGCLYNHPQIDLPPRIKPAALFKPLACKTTPCKHFLKSNGWCPLGDKCDFIHDLNLSWEEDPGKAHSSKKAQHCWAYVQGLCRFERCPYRHPQNAEAYMKYTPCLQWPNCSRAICPFRHPELNLDLPIPIAAYAPSPPAQGPMQFPQHVLPPGPHVYTPPMTAYTHPSQHTHPVHLSHTPRTLELNTPPVFTYPTPLLSPFTPEPHRKVTAFPGPDIFTHDPSAAWANYAIVVSPTTPRAPSPIPPSPDFDSSSSFPFRVAGPYPGVQIGSSSNSRGGLSGLRRPSTIHNRRLSVNVNVNVDAPSLVSNKISGSGGVRLEIPVRSRYKSVMKLPTPLEVMESKAKRNSWAAFDSAIRERRNLRL